MKMGKTSDTSGLTYVESLSDELLPVFEQAEMKYPECAIELFFVFRGKNLNKSLRSDMQKRSR